MMVPLPRVDAQMPLPLEGGDEGCASAGERYRSVPLTLILDASGVGSLQEMMTDSPARVMMVCALVVMVLMLENFPPDHMK